jgi:hypothetical protein
VLVAAEASAGAAKPAGATFAAKHNRARSEPGAIAPPQTCATAPKPTQKASTTAAPAVATVPKPPAFSAFMLQTLFSE